MTPNELLYNQQLAEAMNALAGLGVTLVCVVIVVAWWRYR